MTGGLKRQDAALSLADRQKVDQKIHGRWGVGRWRMCSWKADGEAVAYPWVTVVFPRPLLTPDPPQKRHLLSILCARHCGEHCVSSFFPATLGGCPPPPPFFSAAEETEA